MPATTPRGYPYPLYTDLNNFPAQLQSLATAVDTDIDSLYDRLAAGNAQPSAIVESVGINQSVANNTDVTATFATEVYDNAAMVDLGVSNTNINIVSTGIYLAVARVTFLANATGSRQLSIVSSGALGVIARRTNFTDSSGGVSVVQAMTASFSAVSGTTVTLVQRQNSGAALNSSIRMLAVSRVGSL